jgi:hypothetical protein
MTDTDKLRAYLNRSGGAFDSHALDLLIESWDALKQIYGSLDSHKLHRHEDAHWEDPVLTFTIERHGSYVASGSPWAELERWTVNLEENWANSDVTGYRLMHGWDAEHVASTLFEEIAGNGEDFSGVPLGIVELTADSSVQINIREAVGGSGVSKYMRTKRSKELHEALNQKLKPLGLENQSPGRWRQTMTGDTRRDG